MQPKYKTDLELVGVAKILYELWDNSHYSMGKLGSDKILEKMIYYFGKNWMKDMTEFAGIHEQSCTPLKTLQELEHEIEPLTRTIREVQIGEIIVCRDGSGFEVKDVGKKGVVSENLAYHTFEEMEEDGLKIKQPEPESEIEIAEEVKHGFEIDIENRKLIIELQKAHNELAKLVKKG